MSEANKNSNEFMSTDKFPLFPDLAPGGAEEAQALVDAFKIKLTKAAEEAISNLYTDIIPHIESDAWTNFRHDILSGIKNYRNRKIQSPYDFKEIRQAILRLHRDEIVNDLNQDMLERIAELEKQLDEYREREKSRYG